MTDQTEPNPADRSKQKPDEAQATPQPEREDAHEPRRVREEETYTHVRRVEGGSGLLGCVGMLGVGMALLAAPIFLYACLDLIWTDDNHDAYRWLLTGAVLFVVGVATVAVARMAR